MKGIMNNYVPDLGMSTVKEMRLMDTYCERKLWIAVLRQYFKDIKLTLIKIDEVEEKLESGNVERKYLKRTETRLNNLYEKLYYLLEEVDGERFEDICDFIGIKRSSLAIRLEIIMEQQNKQEILDQVISSME